MKRGLAAVLAIGSFAMFSVQFAALAKEPAVQVKLRGGDSGPCEAALSDGPFLAEPEWGDALRALKRTHPRAEIHIQSYMDTPWRCVGGMMAAIARIGFRKVGFISQPPDAAYR